MCLRVIFVSIILCIECLSTSCAEETRNPNEQNNDIKELPVNNSLPLSIEIISSNVPYHQSFAIYNNYMFLIDANANCHIYSFVNQDIIQTITLPHDGLQVPHANTCCFGPDIEDSPFPFLYVSQWNGEGACLVYKFTEEEYGYQANLVQIINTNFLPSSIYGSTLGDWIIDKDNRYIYTCKYNKATSTNSSDNYNHIMQFPLPSLKTERVSFGISDIISSFDIPFIYAMQDKSIYNETLYISSGLNNSTQKINMIDLKTHSYIGGEDISIFGGEPEGMDIANFFYISYYNNHHLYRILNWLK